ncbi:unnamed protein product [Effrenium voratum]|nr:unnamed protein product [Effrenium voratum]CAJ1450481.1 unnamed protein product [Effrenium voratum]
MHFELEEVERFTAALSEFPLPESLEDMQRLERFQMAILSCVESLYRDREKPYLGQVLKRLRATKLWLPSELRALPAVCAQEGRYYLVPPFGGLAPCLLLRCAPPGYTEWYGNMPLEAPAVSKEEESARNLRAGMGDARCAQLREVVEDLYADRIEPSLPEVQERLRLRGWSFAEAQQAVLLYACQKETYRICKPTASKPVVVFLQETPPGFEGWADGIGLLPEASPDMELGLKSVLAAGLAPRLSGGVAGAAAALQSHCRRSLGELRALVRVFLKKGLLCYSGDELLPTEQLKAELNWLQDSPSTPQKPARIYARV